MGDRDRRSRRREESGERPLATHGVSTIYCLPGVQSDHLFNAMFDVGDALKVVHTRHEQGAAYMALGASLATGKPSVVDEFLVSCSESCNYFSLVFLSISSEKKSGGTPLISAKRRNSENPCANLCRA